MLEQYIQEYCDILNEKYDAANKIMNRTIPYEFVPIKGRKYTKIVQRRVNETKLMGSAHAFIDADGNIYKPASWSAPAKGVRANVKNTEWLRQNATWSGGYLYY